MSSWVPLCGEEREGWRADASLCDLSLAVFFDNNPQAPNKSGKTVLEALGGEPGEWMPMVDKKRPTEVWMCKFSFRLLSPLTHLDPPNSTFGVDFELPHHLDDHLPSKRGNESPSALLPVPRGPLSLIPA